jgi:hypothetical protein
VTHKKGVLNSKIKIWASGVSKNNGGCGGERLRRRRAIKIHKPYEEHKQFREERQKTTVC